MHGEMQCKDCAVNKSLYGFTLSPGWGSLTKHILQTEGRPKGGGEDNYQAYQTQDKTIDKTNTILTHHHEVDPTVATVVNDQPC